MSVNRGLRKNVGLSKTATYKTWKSMMGRCHYPSQDSYYLYGGRGISVCERWHEYSAFLEDMGEKPTGFSLERKEVNGHYEPGNCEWIPLDRQQHNKRNSRFLTYEGSTLTMADWSERTGLSTCLIHWRLKKGWSEARTLSTPARPMKSSEGK